MSDRLTALKNFLGRSASGALSSEWWVFPSPEKPRFIIPTDRRFWKEGLAFVSSRKKRATLRALLHVYHLIRRKSDLSFEGDWPAIMQRSLNDQISHFAAYVSTPSRFSKYTLVLLNEAGQPLGFAKLSEGKDADQAIADEVNALNYLAKEFPESASFPRVIEQAKGFSIQSPAPSSSPGDLPQNAGRITAQLFRLQRDKRTWPESASRRSLLESIHELRVAGRDDLSQLLEEMEQVLSEKSEKIEMREGLTHGDFVSWNMTNCPEGFVFDWEWMAERAEYHDLFHFLWIRELQKKESSEIRHLISRWESQEAQGLLKGYRPDAEPPLCLHALLYLANSFAFYARHCVLNGQDPLTFPFMIAILDNFRAFSKLESQTPCLASSLQESK